jgi:sialate O-acetylesterase
MNVRCKTLCILFFAIIFCAGYAQADVKLPKLISSGMILQRGQPLKIWGWATPGEKITVNFLHKTYHAVTAADGTWQFLMKPIAAGGPYTMDVAGNNQIQLTDILVGDVFFCSGQSNMELAMNDIHERYETEIAQNQNTRIRQFLVPKSITEAIRIHDDYNGGKWAPCTGNDVMRFSAAAYFFAQSLYKREHVPIGILNASWGGTPIEAWLSADGFNSFPAIKQQIKRLSDTAYVNAMLKNNADANKEQAKRTDKKMDEGLNETPKWFEASYHPSGWKSIMVPGYWNGQGLAKFNGVVWFRREINVPASMAGKEAKLYLGRIMESNEVYLNGQLVGTTGGQYAQRRYALKPGSILPGKNIVVVRLSSTSGSGGFVPDKPYYITAGTDTIELSGKWQYKVGQAYETPTKTYESYTPFYQPTVLFNTMVAPAANYKIKGAVWYQGESNTTRAKEYEILLPELIKNWRATWNNKDLAFIYAQLPNYGEAKYLLVESQWAELREAERKALIVPHTGMAVTIDVGDWNDIHPQNKKDVGERLALAAEKVAYSNTTLVTSGPTFKSINIEGNKLIISFTDTGSGLITKGNGKPEYFEVAGSDKRFVKATAEIAGNDIIVSSNNVLHPQYVRYAWADNPDRANIYNKEGLPASPFQAEAINK